MDLDLIQRVGTGMLESYVTGEPPFWETVDNRLFDAGPAHLLGRKFTKEEDGVDGVKEYVQSRLWFTYRRNFAPIGGTGPGSDQGWGCMLRCAQMLLGETLLRRHVCKHYVWVPGAEPSGAYERILRMFFDEKTALYSIHQIAQMGVSEGKAVGEWFGPNTAAQVIKKLAVFDTWSNVAVHVALDNIIVAQDVRTIATLVPPKDAVKLIKEDGNVDESLSMARTEDKEHIDGSLKPNEWRPLLLIVPLRLGLTNINQCYLPAIQEFFKLDSCVGIIGGRPNHALYFVGIAGEKLIYLDPHYCRPMITTSSSSSLLSEVVVGEEAMEDVVQAEHAPGFDDGFSRLEELEPLSSDAEIRLDDSTYHCQMMLYMDYSLVDPSLAIAFFCETFEDYTTLTRQLKENVLPASNPPIFEMLDKRPSYWPPFEPYVGVKTKIEMKEFDDMGAPNYEIDDSFELLDDRI